MAKLEKRYIVEHVDGSPIDEKAEYFVLRLDEGAELCHRQACLSAIKTYADNIRASQPEFAEDLYNRFVS